MPDFNFGDTKIHPAANVFPMMNDEEFAALKADIAENGQHESITYYDGKLLDGRNRLRACIELGIEPLACELDVDGFCDDKTSRANKPFDFVLSHNLHRRHLSTSQRATVAAELAKLKRGSNQHKKQDSSIEPPTIEQAAKQLNVSPASVKRAKQVLEHGSKEVVEAVKRGDIKLNAAEQLLKSVKKGEVPKKVPKAGRTDGKPVFKKEASSSMQFVQIAILQMERIELDDPQRKEAFGRLRKWLDDNEEVRA